MSFHIEGLRELDDALGELTKATAKNVLKRALTKAAEPIEQEAERRAPRLTGHLIRTIRIGTQLTRRQRSQHTKESMVELFVGPAGLVQAITQEFGTAHHGPQPFMRPAWDSNKTTALDNFKKDLGDEIEKARQRAARKAARLLAKMSMS